MKHPKHCEGNCKSCANFLCNYRGWNKYPETELDSQILTEFNDGEILSCCGPGENPCTFICNGDTCDKPSAYCGITTGGDFKIAEPLLKGFKDPWTYGIVRTATKDEIDLLYKKMYEAGYWWNHKERKLIKI